VFLFLTLYFFACENKFYRSNYCTSFHSQYTRNINDLRGNYARLKTLGDRKSPPGQLIPQNSGNCPYPSKVKIPFKKFLDPYRDPGRHHNQIGCCSSHISVIQKKFIHHISSTTVEIIPLKQTIKQRQNNLFGRGKANSVHLIDSVISNNVLCFVM